MSYVLATVFIDTGFTAYLKKLGSRIMRGIEAYGMARAEAEMRRHNIYKHLESFYGMK